MNERIHDLQRNKYITNSYEAVNSFIMHQLFINYLLMKVQRNMLEGWLDFICTFQTRL